MKVLVLEPWHGGSHALFLAQWRARSAHELELRTLPARHWKWRMRGGAWELARGLREDPPATPDVLFLTDYVDVPGLYGLLPPPLAEVPCVLYMHENQLTYPQGPDARLPERDLHFAMTNVLSCLRADGLAFNSAYHRADFARAADAWLARLPRPNPRAELAARLERAEVVPPGIDLDALPAGAGPTDGPLRVLFNHRWEHDKDPAAFLRAVAEARGRGAELVLSLAGQRFDEEPADVACLRASLADAVAHSGYLDSRADYAAELGRADVVVSTARHEFYGIAVLEALAAGCRPLLPRRLSYPELVPQALQGAALYDGVEELVERLVELSADPASTRVPEARARWREAARAHDADLTAARLDALCAAAASGASVPPPRRPPAGPRAPRGLESPRTPAPPP